MMSVEQQQGNHHHHAKLNNSCAAIAFRVGGGLLILTCLLASLANPYRAHPTAAIKTKHVHRTHAKVRRDTVYIDQNSTIKHGSFFDPIDLHLPQFPTLQAELASAEVVVLYFGASWCPQSRATTTAIDQILMPKLKLAPQDSHKKRRHLSVVYVSSDVSKAQSLGMNRNRFWAKVPFQPSAERKRLKKYFETCAKRELEYLQMQRKHEIPHLVVLSGKTHKVVSRRGVEDLKEYGPGVLDHWTKLVRDNVASVAK